MIEQITKLTPEKIRGTSNADLEKIVEHALDWDYWSNIKEEFF
jgi:hypothetical protein